MNHELNHEPMRRADFNPSLSDKIYAQFDGKMADFVEVVLFWFPEDATVFLLRWLLT